MRYAIVYYIGELMKVRELEKILKEYGYKVIRTGKHAIYCNGTKKIAVPQHPGKDLNRNLQAGILKQIGHILY